MNGDDEFGRYVLCCPTTGRAAAWRCCLGRETRRQGGMGPKQLGASNLLTLRAPARKGQCLLQTHAVGGEDEMPFRASDENAAGALQDFEALFFTDGCPPRE